MEFFDYTAKVSKHDKSVLAAHGLGNEYMVLSRLPYSIERESDGELVRYQIDHKKLSAPCTADGGEYQMNVVEAECTLYKYSELKAVLEGHIKFRSNVSLFDHYAVAV